MYNITNISAGISGLFRFTNVVTGGWLGWLSCFAIFVTSFLTLSNSGWDGSSSFATSSFVTLLICVPFWIIGFVPDTAIVLFGVFSAVSIAFLAMGSSK